MPGPWDKYATKTAPSTQDGPWSKYGGAQAAPDQVLPDMTVTASPQESDLQAMGRNALMQGRSVVRGAASLPGIVIDPVTQSINWARHKLGFTDAKYDIPRLSQSVDYALNTAGVPNPQPQNNQEALASRVAEGLGGAAGGVGVGSALQGAGGVAGNVGQQMTKNIGSQLMSGATGSTASELARQAGAGTKGQIAAAILGGLAPIATTSGIPSAVRGALRGGEAGRQAVEGNIAAFNAAGTAPSVGQATQRAALQGIEQTLSRTPGAAGVMLARSRQQAQNISQGLEDVASTISPTASAGKAGLAVKQGVTGPGGFVDTTKQTVQKLYDKLDQTIAPDKRVDISNTMKVLPELNQLIAGAPNTSRLFQNARILGIEKGLNADVNGAEAALTRPDVQQKAAQLLDSIKRQNAQIAARNAENQARTDQLNALRTGQPPVQFTPESLISPEQAKQQVNDLAKSMADGKLPYEALKKLRTLVGTELENNSIVSDVPRSKWKAVYAALSQDMQNAADTPQAKQAWNRANNYFAARMKRIDLLDSAIDKNGGPEKVFSALWSGAKDGNTTLRAVMQSIPPESQRDLSAAFIRRLGKAAPSAQNAEGDVFSTQTFLTNWNRLSPEAKATLFDRYGKNFSDNMDKIAKVAANLREGSQTYANPSGTAAAGAQIAGLTSFVSALASGHLGVAGAIAGGAGTANLWARAMTNPRFVSWLAQQTKVPLSVLPQQVSILRQAADKAGDQDSKDAADAILEAYKKQNKKGKDQQGR